MKRFALIFTASIALVLVTATAGVAAPPNKTNVTLSCDRATIGATVVVTLKASGITAESAPSVTLQCSPGSKRATIATAFPAGYVVVGQFTVSTPVESMTCGAEGTLAFKLACTDAVGGGASVVVR